MQDVSHVWIWELDCEESWALRNWCFWTVVLEKTLEKPLDGKEIKSVNPKVNQSWIFIGRTDAEAEAPILWPPDAKSWLIGKDLNAGKDWGQEEKRTKEDEMAGWHHWLNGHEFDQAQGVGEGQGGLVCCLWGRKKLDTTEQLNNWVLSVAPSPAAVPPSTRPGIWGLSPSNSTALLCEPGQVTSPFHTTSSFPWQETIAIVCVCCLFLAAEIFFFFYNLMKIYSKTQI